jgi:hypothetical protein
MIALAPSPFEIWPARKGYNIALAVSPCTLRQYADRDTQKAFEAYQVGAAGTACRVAESTLETDALRENFRRSQYQHDPSIFIHFQPAFLMAFAATLLGGACLITPNLFAGAFFAAVFLAAFFAGTFLAAFLATAFFTAFFVAFLVGVFFRMSPTDVTASPTAVVTAPTKFDAIPSPVPTATPAFSNIVSSAIFSPRSFCVHVPSGIVAVSRYVREFFAPLSCCWLPGAWQDITALASNSIRPPSLHCRWFFDAFYTTKSDGMGMGLSVSRSIIERRCSRLCGTTNDDHGATFHFLYPASSMLLRRSKP